MTKDSMTVSHYFLNEEKKRTNNNKNNKNHEGTYRLKEGIRDGRSELSTISGSQ